MKGAANSHHHDHYGGLFVPLCLVLVPWMTRLYPTAVVGASEPSDILWPKKLKLACRYGNQGFCLYSDLKLSNDLTFLKWTYSDQADTVEVTSEVRTRLQSWLCPGSPA